MTSVIDGFSNWEGYLLKAVTTNSKFPSKYIAADTWSTTPNQREEIKAYRDENTRKLHRVTASGKKTSISFTTRPNLHLKDKKAIQDWFTQGEEESSASQSQTNASQRRIKLKYWNEEENDYKTSHFYRPDIEFKIKKYTDTDIIYNEITIELVEY